MVTFENLRYYPEFLLYTAMINRGYESPNNRAQTWNDENAKIHKLWEEFSKQLEVNGYEIKKVKSGPSDLPINVED